MKQQPPHLVPLLVVLGALFAAWAQLVLGVSHLKWDALVNHYPFYSSTQVAFSQGEWAYWVPYYKMGFPVNADMGYANWNPFLGLYFALGGGFGFHAFQLYVFGLVLLGAGGMYRLCARWGCQPWVCALVAIAYGGSGFYASHSQSTIIQASAAGLPWLVLALWRLAHKPSAFQAATVGFWVLWQMGSAYASVWMLLIYATLGYFFLHLLRLIAQGDTRAALRWFGFSALAAAFTVLFTAGIVAGVLASGPYLGRNGSISFEFAMTNSYTLKCLLSLLNPAVGLTANTPDTLGTDYSMISSYVGLLPLVFGLAGLPKAARCRYPVFFWFGFGLLALLFSFHPDLPFRAWSYHHVPLLNLFRHSAVFRLFFVFGLLLVAAQSLNAYFAQVPQRRISCTTVLASLTALAIAAAAYWGLKRVGWEGATRFWSQPSFEWLALDGKLPEMLGLYGGVQLVLAAVLLGLLLGRAKIGWMVGLVVLDIALSVQCLMWGPILEAGHTLSDPESDLVTYQHGPTLDLETPFGEFHNGRHEMRAFWTNEHFIVRHPAIDGYGRPTLRFEAFQTMCISKCVWMNPVAYIPSEVLPYSDSASVCNSPRPGVAFAAVEQAQVFPDSSTSVKLESLGFTHNAFRFRVTGALANRMVVLQQNDYPEWRATFNHHPLPTVPVNYTEIAARLPADAPNAGELEFRYAPLPWVQWATKVSYAALGLFGFWAVMRGLRRLWLRS